jgi:ferredoxin
MAILKVTVDLDLCNGYGNCVVAAPSVFDLDPETNLAIILDPRPADEEAVTEAELDCPVRAILVERAP